ncbi:GntR family transcriptional regulator [Bradyrhizobium sp. 179]|uniref:GntR family transcriptional regulator n=1 Tax=Bradyrhizobium sp. 179 TaxID=2782648 RepID=UPI001FFA7F20|nr:GntR family transcriptional regulator [Bradyrhizobium sp. 179]MCK1546430.1 GntR family transcriptional regulator [Bradyrhizobium sp. 179]
MEQSTEIADGGASGSPNALHREIAQRILMHVRMERLPIGAHLTETSLAQVVGTSRGPIRGALGHLASAGYLERRPGQGFFLARTEPKEGKAADTLVADTEQLYLKLAEDRLRGRLADSVTEADLMRRYDVPRHTLRRILTRIVNEGWMQRRTGHGWAFLPMIDSVEAYRESYELRRYLEPQGLLSPTFKLNRVALSEQRERQEFLHSAGYKTLGQVELFKSNSDFHEALALMSGNRFLAQTVARQNELRRLIEYRQTLDRDRVWRQTGEHLAIIDLLENGSLEGAAKLLDKHIGGALKEKARPELFDP